MRWLSVVLGLMAPITVAAQSVGPLQEHVAIRESIRLQESDSVLTVAAFVTPDPLGGFIVADPREAQVRLYDQEGRLTKLVATPGAGPGEVRVPLSAVRGPNGHLLVSDVGNSIILEFDSAGSAELERYPTAFQITRLLATAGRVLAVGSPRATRSEPRPFLVHRWRDGAVSESFFRTPVTRATARTTLHFGFANAAVSGDGEIITTFTLSDTLYVHSAGGHLSRKIPLDLPRWSVPETDPEGALGSPVRAAWREGMTLVTGAFPVGDRILVQASEMRHGELAWRLVGITRDGETLFDVFGTPKLLTVDGADLYFVDAESPTQDRWVVARLR